MGGTGIWGRGFFQICNLGVSTLDSRLSTLEWIFTECFLGAWETWGLDRRLLVVQSANWIRLWSSTDMGLSNAEEEDKEDYQTKPAKHSLSFWSGHGRLAF